MVAQGLGLWLKSRVWVQVWTGVSGCQYSGDRWMNTYGCRCGQVHASLQRLQAVTLRSGVLRRGPTVLCGLLFHVEVPRSLSQASVGEQMEQAHWALQTTAEALGAVLRGGPAPWCPHPRCSPGDGASVGQCWDYTLQLYQEGRVGSHLRGSASTPGTLAPEQGWSRDRARAVSCHIPPCSQSAD